MESLIGHHLSVMKLSTDYHRWDVIRCLMSSQLSLIYKAGCHPVAEKLTELFQTIWRKESIHQKFKDAIIIHLLKRKRSPQVCNNHRDISLLSIARNILAEESYWTDWMNTFNSQGFYQKANEDSRRNNWHDLHSRTASRKMPGTECGPIHDPCRPYQSTWHNRSWETLENYGKVLLSYQVQSNGAAVPRWYACKGPNWWRVFWSIPCDKLN